MVADEQDDHLASARLLPTVRPALLDSLYPDLVDGEIPQGPHVFEITRFCLSRGISARLRREARDRLLVGLADYALANGISDYIETHVRRLEAMRRLGGFVERNSDGSWTIAPDHLAKAAAYERRQAKDRPVAVELLSAVGIDRLPRAEAVTWLDREASEGRDIAARDKGFGREVRSALTLRRQWLIDEELADAAGEGIVYRRGAFNALQRRELLRLARLVAREMLQRGSRATGAITFAQMKFWCAIVFGAER